LGIKFFASVKEPSARIMERMKSRLDEGAPGAGKPLNAFSIMFFIKDPPS